MSDASCSSHMPIVHISDLEDKVIVINNINEYTNTKFNKKGVKVEITVDNEHKLLFTSAMVVMKQILDIHAMLKTNNISCSDIECKVKKTDKGYFILTDA